jgi:hypothetical protein
MKTFEIPSNRMIQLPKALFKPLDKVVVITQGDTFILKKFDIPRLSAIAMRVKERPFPMREILREVHASRRARRAR